MVPSFRHISASIGIMLVIGLVSVSAAPDIQDGAEGMPPLRVFSARDTGVETMAWSAAQDQSGKMFFGCDTVVSFDGDRWHPEKMDPTYLVRGLDVGPNGRIWTAAVNQIGWFDAGVHGDLEYHSLMDRLPESVGDLGDVWRAYALGNDSAIFIARERVLRWDGQRITSWSYPGMHLLFSTRTHKAVYVDYPPVGLLRVASEGPVVAVPASIIGPSSVGWVDDSGTDLFLMTSQGFRRVRNGISEVEDTPASAFVRSNIASSAVRLRDGSIAISTLKGGIAIVNDAGQILRLFNLGTGLPANQVYSLFVDRDGALWGMGPAHIFRLGIGSGSTLYTQRAGYPPGGCDSLDVLNGELFVSSHSDILRLTRSPDPGGLGQFVTTGVVSTRLYGLLSVPQGLAVGHLGGLGLFSQGVMKPISSIKGAVFRTSPSRAHPGQILASLFDRVVSVDPLTETTKVVADSLPDYGDTVVEETSGRVWVGTASRGLFVTQSGETKAIPAGPRYGYMPPTGPAFVSIAASTIVALTDSGAYFLDQKSGRFRGVEGFPGGNPSAISNQDENGSVWAALYPDAGGHSPKVGKISILGDKARWTPQSIEGLSAAGSILGLRMIGKPGQQALWMSGTEVLLRAGPTALAPRSAPRVPVIRSHTMSSLHEAEAPVFGTLPYATAGVHTEYSSFEYGMRESEHFETLLGGAETQWSPPSDTPERDISGLREGTYDFRVRLVTDSGEASEPAVLHFAIAPPWWRTGAAKAAFALGMLLASLGVLRLRTRALKHRAAILEKQVRQRTDELEKANAAKTEFVASMSHEIRNPMGGILASALELSDTPLEPHQQKLVTTLQTCASFLASLVEDVLDFAAIEAGAYKVSRSRFSPRDLLETVVKMLEPGGGAACMTVVVDPDLPEAIMGDSARVQQVIVNFAANSLKFGGKTIWLSARSDGDHVVFNVTDDGVGIPADEQKNLFIRFSRLKSAPNSAIPGTGLGLAVSRALAERMGGTVGFSSAPGGGSIFYLRIPLEAAIGPEAEDSDYKGRGMRALIVEDIDYNARALALMLGRQGFQVDVAADGEEALAFLAKSHYHAVFLDCDLPRVSGIEVARRHRAAEPPGTRTLIIATTALSTADDRSTCISAGMDAFISKPITPSKLRAVLSDLVGNSMAGEPTAIAPMAARSGIDLGIIVHLTDGTSGSLEREIEKYIYSLNEALRDVKAAHAAESRSGVSSAAHRVLSLARMVGAQSLAESAADLQDFAAAFTDSELAGEVDTLAVRAELLKAELERLSEGSSLNSYPAS
jgi:signal transduction histidine kinase/DNA-binding response OmpR family regulator